MIIIIITIILIITRSTLSLVSAAGSRSITGRSNSSTSLLPRYDDGDGILELTVMNFHSERRVSPCSKDVSKPSCDRNCAGLQTRYLGPFTRTLGGRRRRPWEATEWWPTSILVWKFPFAFLPTTLYLKNMNYYHHHHIQLYLHKPSKIFCAWFLIWYLSNIRISYLSKIWISCSIFVKH